MLRGLWLGAAIDGNLRAAIFEKTERMGFEFPAIVSPQAVLNEDVTLGAGTIVMDGVVIGTGTRVGKAVIANTHCSIDHDCNIEDFVHVAPGATICGGVIIGRCSLVGAGATVIQGIAIGADCVLGAGSVVVNNCTASGVYMGVPAQAKQ